jgi:CubicO group peptidase (beta-lactamase class C family)
MIPARRFAIVAALIAVSLTFERPAHAAPPRRSGVGSPMQYEAGSKWNDTPSGINAAARLVEVVSGQSFDVFLQKRMFGALGLTNTAFLSHGGAVDPGGHQVRPEQGIRFIGGGTGAEGIWSARPSTSEQRRQYWTAEEDTHFCEMLLRGSIYLGRRLHSPSAMSLPTNDACDVRRDFQRTASDARARRH